jgi:hypothetical protein
MLGLVNMMMRKACKDASFSPHMVLHLGRIDA